ARVWERLERGRLNAISLVGDAMARPLADALAAGASRRDLSSLIAIGSGGAALSDAVKGDLEAQLPNVFVIDSFGSSETGYQGRKGAPSTAGTTVLDDDLRPVEPGSGVVGRLA